MARKELFMQKLNKQIDKLIDIIVESILSAKSKDEAAALTLWPLPTPQGVLYWGDEWSKKLNWILHLIDKQKIDNEKIARVLKFPSRATHFLWRTTDAVKNSSLNKKEKLYTIKKLFEILAVFRKKDLFCENGKNIIWDKKELENRKKDLYFFSGKDKKLNKLISTFKTALWIYTELIYWAQHSFGHSFHGPYLEKEEDLLVREYFDLKPQIWSFSQGLNFSEVEIFEIYKKGTNSKIKLEFFERSIRTTQPIKQDLEKFAFKVDEKVIKNSDEISLLSKNLIQIIKRGGKIIQSLNEQKLIEKHADYYFYVIKPLCDLVKEDWRLPKQVHNNIYKKYQEINAVWHNVVKKDSEKIASLSYKQQKKILKEIFDPRK